MKAWIQEQPVPSRLRQKSAGERMSEVDLVPPEKANNDLALCLGRRCRRVGFRLALGSGRCGGGVFCGLFAINKLGSILPGCRPLPSTDGGGDGDYLGLMVRR